MVADYRRRIAELGVRDKPVMQSLYVDVLDDATAGPRPIHLGFQSGVDFLKTYLCELRARGVNHVALNLRFNQADVEETLEKLAEHVLPELSGADDVARCAGATR